MYIHFSFSFQKEIERLNDEFKSAKKMFNEEKSLKIFAENKIRLLEIDLEKKDNELKSLESYCVAKDEEISGLKEQVCFTSRELVKNEFVFLIFFNC